MTTDETGFALSSPLHKGRYTVREHDNPTGYIAELVEMQAEVRSDETTDLSATNQPIQGRIQIIKWDQLTKEALAGAEFTIGQYLRRAAQGRQQRLQEQQAGGGDDDGRGRQSNFADADVWHIPRG